MTIDQAPPSKGERWADALTKWIGSWYFIVIQSMLMVVWFFVNSVAIFKGIWFDHYPFIALNLFMSAEAAFATPIILMSGNRTDKHVLQILESDYTTDSETNILVERIADHLGVSREVDNP